MTKSGYRFLSKNRAINKKMRAWWLSLYGSRTARPLTSILSPLAGRGGSKGVAMLTVPSTPESDETPLYAPSRKAYPQKVSGPYRRIKWGLLVACLGVYYLLLSCAGTVARICRIRRFCSILPTAFLFLLHRLWPQEVYYFTGLLVLAALTLFLMNAVAGRLWCGYLCPQTVLD